MKRYLSIDFLRGIVILLMTLDHVRDMFSSVSIGEHLGSDLPLSYYITRWITHFCAPTFVFLSGLSIFLKQQAYPQTRTSLQRFVVKRGLFLILVSSSIVSFFWSFILHLPVFTIICAELWAIGASMIFIAFMLYFKPFTIFAVSLSLVLFHNFLDPIQYPHSILWSMLHVPSELVMVKNYINVIFYYPLLPWFGIAGLGYSLGYYCFNNSEKDQVLLKLAGAAFLGFIILRASNIYGDPNPFVLSTDIMKSLFSFFDVTKYPPSLLYSLLTLAFIFSILSFDNKRFFSAPKAWVKIISRYGECALPYYVVHLFLISFYAKTFAGAFNNGELISSPSLWISYAVTALVIISMYPFVLWFKKMRSKHKEAYPILTYF